MHRFYLPPAECGGDLLLLSERDAHHANNVLRLKRGDGVVVLDGAGSVFDCDVAEVARRQVSLKVRKKEIYPRLPCRITLVQAIPKGKTMDSIVQKATELGTFRIVPLISERTNVQLGEDSATAKQEKWQLTAIEAIKQCGSPWLTSVAEPMSTKEFLEKKEHFDLSLIASLEANSQHPRKYLGASLKLSAPTGRSTCVWIGPEGDFSPAEYAAVQIEGALPISLGPLVLRSETAAIYCLSILNYEFQVEQNLV